MKYRLFKNNIKIYESYNKEKIILFLKNLIKYQFFIKSSEYDNFIIKQKGTSITEFKINKELSFNITHPINKIFNFYKFYDFFNNFYDTKNVIYLVFIKKKVIFYNFRYIILDFNNKKDAYIFYKNFKKNNVIKLGKTTEIFLKKTLQIIQNSD